jgi:hypothetical protein
MGNDDYVYTVLEHLWLQCVRGILATAQPVSAGKVLDIALQTYGVLLAKDVIVFLECSATGTNFAGQCDTTPNATIYWTSKIACIQSPLLRPVARIVSLPVGSTCSKEWILLPAPAHVSSYNTHSPEEKMIIALPQCMDLYATCQTCMDMNPTTCSGESAMPQWTSHESQHIYIHTAMCWIRLGVTVISRPTPTKVETDQPCTHKAQHRK